MTTIALAGKDGVGKKKKRPRGDPDSGLIIRDEVLERLLRQKLEVDSGERGQPLEFIVEQLGLNKEQETKP